MEKNYLNDSGKLLVIGGSAGSLEVLLQVLPEIDSIGGLTIVIVLHRRNSDDNMLEELLRMKTSLSIREIEDKTDLKPGHVYMAPANYHLLFENNRTFSLDVSEKVNFSRPSIDVALESAADIYGSGLIAVLLSGANADGSQGLKAVRAKGGTVIIQLPDSAEVPFMPAAALKAVQADFVFSPTEITSFISRLARG